jgi:hypothetical protein
MLEKLVRKRSIGLLTSSITLIVVFVVSVMGFGISSAFDRPNIMFGTLASFGIAAIVTPLISYGLVKSFKRSLENEDELRDALAKVETLSGLIPICSVCKDVRDDSGYWKKIEEYLHVNTDAKLSHGICPSCVEGEYNKLEDFRKRQNGDVA